MSELTARKRRACDKLVLTVAVQSGCSAVVNSVEPRHKANRSLWSTGIALWSAIKRTLLLQDIAWNMDHRGVCLYASLGRIFR